MEQVGHRATVEKLYALYDAKGFLREDEALEVMAANGASLVGINLITERLLALGVIFVDDFTADEDEDIDHSQTDYEALYSEVLEISPGQQMLVDYIRKVRPPQNREWRSLIKQMNSGSEYAFNRLFDMYLRVVLRIALRFHRENGFEIDDAIQEGSMGLVRAINQYDGSKHGNLGAYLPLWIQQYISRAVADKGRIIRLPVHVYETVQRLRQSHKEITEKLGREPSYAEIAIEAEIPVEAVLKLLEATQEQVSLESFLEDEANDEVILRYFSVPSFEEEADNEYSEEYIRKSLSTLTERERFVISLRYGLYDGQERTLEDIGSDLHVTRERIRQIEAKALRKLRSPSSTRHIEGLI
jgi:RNA polymerase primary sigma factor